MPETTSTRDRAASMVVTSASKRSIASMTAPGPGAAPHAEPQRCVWICVAVHAPAVAGRNAPTDHARSARPVLISARQDLAQSGLVPLLDADARRLDVADLVPQAQRDLLRASLSA